MVKAMLGQLIKVIDLYNNLSLPFVSYIFKIYPYLFGGDCHGFRMVTYSEYTFIISSSVCSKRQQ